MTYHCMKIAPAEEEMNNLGFLSETRKLYYMLIMTFTKMDMVIKSMTRKEHKDVKLHQAVDYYLLFKTYIILEEEIQYVFPENLAVVARRLIDVKLIKKDKEMGV